MNTAQVVETSVIVNNIQVYVHSDDHTQLDLLQVDLLASGASLVLDERRGPCLAAKRPTASDEVAKGPRHMKSDEGLLESLILNLLMIYLSIMYNKNNSDKPCPFLGQALVNRVSSQHNEFTSYLMRFWSSR